MRTITSESPNGKQRIVIDPSSETVTFINCYTPPATSFFTLGIRRQAEFVCPFTDILNVYCVPYMMYNECLFWRTPKVHQIATATGNAFFSANWSNSDEARSVLREISASTSDAPALRNPNIVTILRHLGFFMAAAIFIALYLWLTGK